MKWLALSFALVLTLCTASAGKDKYAPLPDNIVSAKKVLILNRTGVPEAADSAYKEVRSWGRYTIVEKMEDADLVFALNATQTGEQTLVLYLGNDTVTTNATSTGYGNTVTGNATTTVNRAPAIPITTARGFTTLYIFDPKTPGAPALWMISRPWSSKGATKTCIKELRKRVENK